MKVGLLGRLQGAVDSRFEWIAQAFRRMGHTVVRPANFGEAAAACAACALVVFEQEDAGFTTAEWQQLSVAKKSPWVQWWFNLADGAHYQDVMRRMDLSLVRERDRLADYHRLGIRAEWIEQACPATIGAAEHHEAPDWDVLVLANRDTDELRDVRLLVDEGYSVGWWSFSEHLHVPHGVESLEAIPVAEFTDLASRTCVVLGVDHRPWIAGALNDAEILALGAGTCLVRPFREGLPPLTLFTYDSQERLLSLLSELRQSVETRRSLGELARRQVLEAHTYEHRIAQILTLLGLSSR